MGGPGVYPLQPDGVMNVGQNRRSWPPSPGEDRYRRGIYTFFWRSTPHPALMVFDAPTAMESCTQRLRSNTPLQALVLLNDPSFVEAARAFAQRVLHEEKDDGARISSAFQRATSRRPEAEEVALLRGYLEEQRAVYRADPESAAALS